MVAEEPAASGTTVIRIQETAIEIVCCQLLGDESRNEPPKLHKRESAPPDPISDYRKRLIENVKYWMQHQRNEARSGINPNQLERLKSALNTARADQVAIKRSRRRPRIRDKK